MNNRPNTTYIDEYITDGHKAILSLKNFYNTILISKDDSLQHIYRVPFEDFFIKYKKQLSACVEYYSLPESMYYQPKTVSLELYGTTEMWLSLLRVNGMRNITEFHIPIIKIYNPDEVKELINIFFKREKVIT